MTTKKEKTEWVLVEAVSMFRMRYMIEVPAGKAEWALDTVVCNEAQEFSQEHLDEVIISHRVVSEKEVIALCDQDNPTYASWNKDKKFNTFCNARGKKGTTDRENT